MIKWQKAKLSDLRGKVVMLQFTASWCGVCRKEMPFIEKDIWQKHKDNEAFALYGVDRDEPLDKVVAFAKQTGVTYPLGLDPGADIFAKYADRKAGITRNVLIDKAGKIMMFCPYTVTSCGDGADDGTRPERNRSIGCQK